MNRVVKSILAVILILLLIIGVSFIPLPSGFDSNFAAGH